jgi:hypothetical protein
LEHAHRSRSSSSRELGSVVLRDHEGLRRNGGLTT